MICQQLHGYRGFPNISAGKESTINSRDRGDRNSNPEPGRSPGEGNGNLLQYSCLGIGGGQASEWPLNITFFSHLNVSRCYLSVSTLFIKMISLCCSVTQSCSTLCDPMDCNMPGFPVLLQLLEIAQTHVHRVGDAIQPSHPVIPFSSCLHQVQFLGWEDPLEEEMATVSSSLAWRIPWTEER